MSTTCGGSSTTNPAEKTGRTKSAIMPSTIFERSTKPVVEQFTRRKQDKYYSSSLGGCVAKQLFKLADFEESNPSTNPRMTRIFNIGDDIEYRGNKWLKSWGYTIFGRNYRLEGINPNWTGKIDGFIVKDGLVYPYDWKSAAEYPFKQWIQAAGLSTTTNQAKGAGWVSYDPRESPNPDYAPIKQHSLEYYYQAQAYMHGLQEIKHQLPFQLGDGFYFLVCNKNDGFLYEEFVQYHPEDIVSRLLTLDTAHGIITTGVGHNTTFKKPTKALAKKIRKVREYTDKSKRPCNYCSFVDLCWDKD